MRICLLGRDPEHPLLAATAALLTPRHEVTHLDPEAAALPTADRLADVYLLKARSPRALALARGLEAAGAPVINSAAATELCQDRTAMAELARGAGLPFAATRTADRLAELADPRFPLVVKSRHSRRHDLVARVDDDAGLRALAARWPDEPVVTQPYLPSTGWDQKLWVIDGQVFAARRRSELSPAAEDPGTPLGARDLPADRLDLALRVGEVFGLEVYGVDLLDGTGAPVIVDVNAFPGVRGQAGAPRALAELALRVGRHGRDRRTDRRTAEADAWPRKSVGTATGQAYPRPRDPGGNDGLRSYRV
ncbi:ATP-grasp domain-containing protein, partial [Kitasatospora sp. NPDC004240]